MNDPDAAPPPGPLRPRPALLTLAVVAIVTTGLILTSRPAGPGAEPEADGPEATDFTVELLDGGRFSLSEHLASDGRPIVLNFWASWCPPCRLEMPDFDLVARAHPEVLFLGIAVEDTAPNARSFADEVSVSYPIGVDTAGEVARALPFFALPTTWIIDGRGTILRQVQGAITAADLTAMLARDL